MSFLSFTLLSALGVYGVLVSGNVSCTALADNAADLGDLAMWYWKLGPYIL